MEPTPAKTRHRPVRFRFTRAAGGGTAKQGQFSRQIKELEQFFGIDLLDRDVQPHRLTPEGRALTEIACEMLGRLDDYALRCSNLPVGLSIGAGESLIQWLLMPHLEAYRKVQPTTSIRFLAFTKLKSRIGMVGRVVLLTLSTKPLFRCVSTEKSVLASQNTKPKFDSSQAIKRQIGESSPVPLRRES